MPTPPRADDQNLVIRSQRWDLLHRTEGREPRTHIGGRQRRRRRAIVDQISRMGDHDVAGVAAGRASGAPEVARSVAIVFLAAEACGALAAADPGVKRSALADLHTLCVGPEGDHFPRDLVAKRMGQRQGKGQLLLASKANEALMDMNVGVADTAAFHPHQHLGARRRRRRALDPLQRLAELCNGFTIHGGVLGLAAL